MITKGTRIQGFTLHRVPTPFSTWPADFRAQLEATLSQSLYAAFTVQGCSCLLEVGEFPHFKADTCQFHTWLRQALCQIHQLLKLLSKEPPEIEGGWAINWYTNYIEHPASISSVALTEQLQALLLQLPVIVVQHVLPVLPFAQQMECVCRMAFWGCVPLMQRFCVARPPTWTSYTRAYFRGHWRNALYRQLSPQDGFHWHMLEAYNAPVARLVDHYRFHRLLCSMG